jgi:tRNA nucleotidyltransferase (CCA-adding enzyme)
VGVFDRDGVMHEVTTFRRDVRTDGRHAVVQFGASLEEDLARRDYTINAIAFSPSSGELRDPFGGVRDLERRVVRAVGDPAARLREDWLRALRGIRFAARFEFAIESSTWEAIANSGPYLTRLSRERVKQELEKTMQQVRRPSTALMLWHEAGALQSLIPQLAMQPWSAFLAADAIPLPGLTSRPERQSARLSARITVMFLGLPAGTVRTALRELRFSNAGVHWMAHLAEQWLALESEMAAALGGAGASERAIRRWAAAVGRTRLAGLVRVAAARWLAAREAGAPAPSAASVASLYRRALRIAYRDPIELGDLAIDGDDLVRAGFAPGPVIGKILRALLELVIEEPARNTADRLLSEAKRRFGEGGAFSTPES